MTGLCGWMTGASAPDAGIIDRMAAASGRNDDRLPQTAQCSMGALAIGGSPFSTHIFSDDQWLAAVWGDLHFKDEQARTTARRHGVACALAQGFQNYGREVVKRLGGSFALAVLERKSGLGFLAVDRMAARPLCYTVLGRTLVFGSSLDALDAFPGVPRTVSTQAVFDYVYLHVVPSPATIYRGRTRLLPGNCLLFRDGAVEVSSYWRPEYDEHEKQKFCDLQVQFRDVVRRSVARFANKGRVGAFLSGGTDSSTIAGMLRAVTGEPPRTYSIGFEAEGFDEMRYARIAARHFAGRHVEYYVTPEDVADAIPKIAAAHDQPFGNSSAVPAYYCAKVARGDGIDLLLGGDGGDELFGGNTRYAVQYLYSLYSDLPANLRKLCIEPIAFSFPANIAGKVQRYIRSASMPMPARYDKFNLVEHFGAEAIFDPEFLACIDAAAPRNDMRSVYEESRGYALINRMLAFDLKYTLADNDLPKVTRSCELAGVEAAFPMLDDTVVDFAARLPPKLKLKGTKLRYLFKQALRDFLPHEILTKKKHGFGLPFGVWLQKSPLLAELANDTLSDLKARAIIHPSFIDELTSTHVHRHPNYFSTMVWVLMMLEQWFKRVAPAVDSPGSHAHLVEAA